MRVVTRMVFVGAESSSFPFVEVGLIFLLLGVVVRGLWEYCNSCRLIAAVFPPVSRWCEMRNPWIGRYTIFSMSVTSVVCNPRQCCWCNIRLSSWVRRSWLWYCFGVLINDWVFVFSLRFYSVTMSLHFIEVWSLLMVYVFLFKVHIWGSFCASVNRYRNWKAVLLNFHLFASSV